MAGKIRSVDIEHLKSTTNIVDVVSDHVALKPAGIDSFKGLCPFHDERSPSFHVRPGAGYYHCFGCGESGDAISFLQKLEHLTFVEAVEKLAAKIGFQLQYEEGFTQKTAGPSKTRMLEANMRARLYFENLLFSDAGQKALSFLNQKGFSNDEVKEFGIGLAPVGWQTLSDALVKEGYTAEELISAGLSAKGKRGIYDRFRGRIMWPIKDAAGQTIGFGARKLFDDDEGPKYLNTPETAIYQKSRVLYGLDMAKKAISQKRQVVVVEGYTDVMACHLSGVKTAVATCGTAFGGEHISLIRRIMADDPSAEVIFTFDPDEAGTKAALRAFSQEHLFAAQTFVAPLPEGLDPADMRLQRGAEALASIFDHKIPLFSFALSTELAKYDLNTTQGRLTALREVQPILQGIRDPQAKKEYAREIAIEMGMELSDVFAVLNSARSQPGTVDNHQGLQTQTNQGLNQQRQSNKNSHSYRLERDAIVAILQFGSLAAGELLEQFSSAEIFDDDLRVIRDAITSNLQDVSDPNWLNLIAASLPDVYLPFLQELSVTPVPQKNAANIQNYVNSIIAAVLERDLLGLKREMLNRLQRVNDPTSTEYRNIQNQIKMLEEARRKIIHD